MQPGLHSLMLTQHKCQSSSAPVTYKTIKLDLRLSNPNPNLWRTLHILNNGHSVVHPSNQDPIVIRSIRKLALHLTCFLQYAPHLESISLDTPAPSALDFSPPEFQTLMYFCSSLPSFHYLTPKANSQMIRECREDHLMHDHPCSSHWNLQWHHFLPQAPRH